MTNPSPSTPCNLNPKQSPSPSFQSSAPDFQSTIWFQLNLSHRPHGDRGDVDLFAPGPSTLSAHASSSDQPTDEGPDSQAINSSLNMDLTRWNEGYEVYNSMDWVNYLDQVPEELPQDAQCVNVRNWMQGSPSSPLGPGVAVPWEPAPRKQKRVHDIIDVLGQVLPASSTAGGNAACATLASAPAPTSGQAKRSWSRCRTESDSNDDEQCDSRRRKMAPPPVGQQTSANHPTYPKMITQVIRELVDEDFENSCEYCFFYLQEPYKYINKPWTSCGKPRAEISHIVAHAISDHGLIRGRNSQRQNQRYLTRCATHKSESKGKSECEHCKGVEHWTEKDLADEAHEGEAVCLRCYTQLPTKKELYEHLKELSICVYRQDWPMRRKTRILYSVFCSPDEVPKFAPPPGAIRGDGARKRNEKVCRRTSQKPRGTNGQGPSRSKILTTRTQRFSSHNSDFAGDVSGNYFPAPPQHALVPRQPMPSYIDVGLPQNTPEPPDYTPSFHGLSLTMPITQAETRSLLSSPSMPMSQDKTQPMLSSPSMPMNQNEGQPMLSTPSLPSQYSQNMAGWQIRGHPMGKNVGYGSTDSGFVSQSNEDSDNRNPLFDENIMFESEYFNDAWSDLPRS